VVEAFGGTCRVERSARRVYIDLPPFWKVSPDAPTESPPEPVHN